MSSLAMDLVKSFLRRQPKLLGDAATLSQRTLGRPYPAMAPLPASLRAEAEVHERQVSGQTVFTFTPHTGRTAWHIVYTHGGAYMNALLPAHWAIVGELMRVTGASVTVPIYPLAPEHTYRTTYDLLEEIYRDLLARVPAQSVILAGDSAGGGLALGQAMRYRDLGLPAPGRLLLFAPWVELTAANPAVRALEPYDVMLGVDGAVQAGKWWAGEDDPSVPLLSPLNGDLAGLPPMDLFQGTADVLLPDTLEFARRVKAAGGEANLRVYDGAFHVFMGATFLPESRDVYRRIGERLGTPERAGSRGWRAETRSAWGELRAHLAASRRRAGH